MMDASSKRVKFSENEQLSPPSSSDSLLSCLIWFTKHFHKPYSEKALTAGLPLVDHRLTPVLFVRAAERAHLTAQVCKKELNNITSSMLPIVVILNNGESCVLTKITKQKKLTILQPEYAMGVKEITLPALAKIYSGSIIFVNPAYKFTERSDESLVTKDSRNWFWRVMIKIWPIYSEVLIASLLINIFALAIPLFVMNVYDRVVPNHAIETLWVLTTGVFIVFVFDFGMRLLRSYFIDVAGKSVDQNLSAHIFEQILGIKMMARPHSVGAFSNTIQSFESFRDFITSSTVTVLVDLPFAFLYITIIAIVGGSLALVPLLMIPLVIFVSWLIQIPLTSLTQLSYRYANEKHATLIESLSGVETIKSIGAETPMQRRWEHVTQLSAHLGIKLRFYSNLNIFFSTFSQQLTYIIVIIWGVYKIANGDMTTGGLIACGILTSRAMAPTAQIAALLTRYYQSKYSLESLNKVMELPVERPHGKSYIHRPEFQGTIEFRQVNFYYPQQTLPALKNINFKILPGEKIAIIGRIGSGKSTIAKLILGLYQPTSGTIFLDNIEQQQIDLAELRHNMGYVPQDIMLFYGSVKENIVFGAPYVDDTAILRAATIAGVDQVVRHHPQGFDMQVGERGLYLSGGQRQAVAVARAFLLDPAVVVMDEPTNSMDDKTEGLLKNTMAEAFQNKTMILVTHKASMLSLVNRLIIMDAGQIVADGPKEEVIKALAEGKIHSPYH
jgi:ATP-binding cassette subfamily C protein LapB